LDVVAGCAIALVENSSVARTTNFPFMPCHSGSAHVEQTPAGLFLQMNSVGSRPARVERPRRVNFSGIFLASPTPDEVHHTLGAEKGRKLQDDHNSFTP
jgi:hypothetical protein